jgi:hypothetical protein
MPAIEAAVVETYIPACIDTHQHTIRTACESPDCTAIRAANDVA